MQYYILLKGLTKARYLVFEVSSESSIENVTKMIFLFQFDYPAFSVQQEIAFKSFP